MELNMIDAAPLRVVAAEARGMLVGETAEIEGARGARELAEGLQLASFPIPFPRHGLP